MRTIKIKIGESYDKETKKSLPVYVTAFENDEGNFEIRLGVFLNEGKK